MPAPTPEDVHAALTAALTTPAAEIKDVDKSLKVKTAAELRDSLALLGEIENDGGQRFVHLSPDLVEL